MVTSPAVTVLMTNMLEICAPLLLPYQHTVLSICQVSHTCLPALSSCYAMAKLQSQHEVCVACTLLR